jgi:hypothetical protein
MPNLLVAGNSTNGGTAISTDTSGTLNIVTGSGSGATAVTVDGSQNLSFNSGYGSAAVAYGCRAWVNFNGTGTVAIRASGNVTSITDNGTGSYTVNLTTSLPDVNGAVLSTTDTDTSTQQSVSAQFLSAASARVRQYISGSLSDASGVFVAIFR